MGTKKCLAAALVIMMTLLCSIPVMASSDMGFDFTLGAGESDYAGPADKFAGTSTAAVEVYQWISSYTRDNVYFRLYKSASISFPITQTKCVNGPYSFDLNYTSSGTSYSGEAYLRGYGSAANLDDVWAYGIFWA